MIYPENFENKIGFDEIRTLLKNRCLSVLGKELVDKVAALSKAEEINELLEQTREFRRIMEESDDFPLQFFFDLRESIARIRIEGTHLEESELFDLRRSLDTIAAIVKFLRRTNSEVATDENGTDHSSHSYPSLVKLTENVTTFPKIGRASCRERV